MPTKFTKFRPFTPAADDGLDPEIVELVLARLQNQLSPSSLEELRKMLTAEGAEDEPPAFSGRPRVGSRLDEVTSASRGKAAMDAKLRKMADEAWRVARRFDR